MRRPNEPDTNAATEVWLVYWKGLRTWAKQELSKAIKTVERDRNLTREARKQVKKYEKQVELLEINWNGKTPLPHYAKEVQLAQGYGLSVTATVGRPGVHSSTSYHYQSPRYAVDIASGSVSGMKQAQEALLKKFGAKHFKELFGPCSWYVKNGQKINLPFPDHGDHVHFAA